MFLGEPRLGRVSHLEEIVTTSMDVKMAELMVRLIEVSVNEVYVDGN